MRKALHTISIWIILFSLIACYGVTAVAQTREEKLAAAESTFNEAIQLSEANKDELIPLALQKFHAAQRLYHEIGDKRSEGNALRGVARAYLSLKKRGEAIQAYQQALNLFEEIPRKSAVARVNFEIGNIYGVSVTEKDLRLAIEYYGKALPLLTEPDDRALKALVLRNTARVYVLLRLKPEALKFSQQAAALFKEIDNKEEWAEALAYVGQAYDISLDPDDKRQALKSFQESLALYATLDNKNDKELKNEIANTWLNSGNAHLGLGDRSEAILCFLAALKIYRELKSPDDVAVALGNLALAYAASMNENELRLAISAYLECIQIYGDQKPAQADALAKLGDLYFRLRNKDEALRRYKEAQAIYQELSTQNISFKPGVAKGFSAIGSAYEYLGTEAEHPLGDENYKKAKAIFQELDEVFLKQNLTPARIQILRELGDVEVRLNDRPAAVNAYKKAATLCAGISDAACEAIMMSAVGMTYSQSKETDDAKQAIAAFQTAQALYHKIGDLRNEIWVLKQIALGYDLVNDWTSYAKTSADLLAIAQSLKPPYREILTAEVQMAVADAADNRGDTKTMAANLEAARAIGKALKNRKLEIEALAGLIRVEFVLGDAARMLKLSGELLPMLTPEEPHSQAMKGFVYLMQGYAYSVLGDDARSKELMEAATGLLQSDDPEIAEFKELFVGNSYLVTGQKEKERGISQKIAREVNSIKDNGARTFALYYLATSAANANDYDKALDYAQQCVTLSRQINVPPAEIQSLLMIGFIKWERDQNQEAIDVFQEAMVVSEAQNARLFEVYALIGLMDAWKDQHNPELAIFFGKQTVKTHQALRRDIKNLDSELQKGYVGRLSEFYEGLTRLLLEQGRAAEAQQVINIGRDQEFFDIGRHQGESVITEVQFTPREAEYSGVWEAQLNKAATALKEVQILKANEAMRATVESSPQGKNYKASYAEFQAALKKIEAAINPGVAAKDSRIVTTEVTQMQTALCDLSKSHKTYALYTFISDEKFYVLLNKCGAPVEVFASPIKADTFNQKLLQFYRLVQSQNWDPRKLGHYLYNIIIPKELDRKLQNEQVDTLLWSLDKNLRYIPVGALSPDGSTYLVERYNNVLFTRAKTERLTRKVSTEWTGYGFFTSEPHVVKLRENDADKEEQQIPFGPLDKGEKQIFRTPSYPQGAVKGDVFAEGQFTSDTLFSTLTKGRPLVHISSHFRFVPGNPNLSFLLLGDGNILTLTKLKDKQNIFGSVELLTLSACDTAAQLPNADGKEIDAFAELAQRLGAGSVLATLWPVRDVSTTRLMKDFYSSRELEKLSKPEALRRSQLNLLRGNVAKSNDSTTGGPVLDDKAEVSKGLHTLTEIAVDEEYQVPFRSPNRLSHPFYWAPFVLFGNSR